MGSAVENIIVAIKYKVDTDDIKKMRSELNQTRNMLNAEARELDKNTDAWRQLKSEVRDINKVLNLTDMEFAKGIDLLRQQKAEADKLSNANNVLNQRFSRLDDTSVKYRNTLSTTARGLTALVHGVVTINPLIENQTGLVGEVSKKIDEYGVSILAASSLLRDLGSLAKTANVGFLAGAGVMTTLAAGVTSVASAFTLMYKNMKYAMDLFESGGSFWDFMTTGVFNPSDKLDNSNKEFFKIQTPEERIDAFRKQMEKAGLTGDVQGPGSEQGAREFMLEKYRDSIKTDKGGGKGGKEKLEKEISNDIIDLTKQIDELVSKQSITDPTSSLFYQYSLQIEKLQSQIDFLKMSITDLTKITSKPAGEDLLTGRSPIAPVVPDKLLQFRLDIQAQDEEKAKRQQAIDDTETVYSGITSILSALNIGTETFVGKILSGLDSAVTIIKSLQTINSVLGIFGSIFGGGGGALKAYASGGEALAGMPYMAGERGTELIFPQTNHTVLNHSDTMRYLNSNSGGQVNVYLSSNVNQRYLDVGIEKHNSTKNYIKVSKR